MRSFSPELVIVVLCLGSDYVDNVRRDAPEYGPTSSPLEVAISTCSSGIARRLVLNKLELVRGLTPKRSVFHEARYSLGWLAAALRGRFFEGSASRCIALGHVGLSNDLFVIRAQQAHQHY